MESGSNLNGTKETQGRVQQGIGSMCCGADKYVDPANELCEREQPKQ